MDVDGISIAKAQQIADASVVSGYVDDNGNLVLVNGGGAEINAGPIRVLGAWPIGSIFTTLDPANPAVLLGGGTWVRFGKGRVLVGLDENDATFDSVGETGGEKAHTLSIAEMPSHNHGGATGNAGAHQHNHDAIREIGGGINAYGPGATPLTPGGTTGSAGDHGHTIGAQGGGGAHNNLQPFITVYMWQRTA